MRSEILEMVLLQLLRPMLDVFPPSPLPRHRSQPKPRWLLQKPQQHRIRRILEGQRPPFWRRPIADFASCDVGKTPWVFDWNMI